MKFNLNFLNVPVKKTSLDDIKAFLNDNATKRINFATSHVEALKPSSTKYEFGKIVLPFDETINPIMSSKLNDGIGGYLFSSQYDGYWRRFTSEKDKEDCKKFIDEYNQIVFLRDTLELSIALSMNMLDNDERTEIGELEYQAKYHDDKDAETKLTENIQQWLEELPYYYKANAICAMPCSDSLTPSLPRRITNNLKGFENLSSSVNWNNKNRKLKDLDTIEEKLEALDGFQLQVNSDLSGKNVILLDDLYMSGVSMQFVAMKLKEAGAERVFGISIVKSRSNTAR